MLAKCLPLHTPLNLGVKTSFFSFLKIVMLHVKLNGNEAANTMQANILPSRWGQKVKIFFSEEGHDASHIKGKEV